MLTIIGSPQTTWQGGGLSEYTQPFGVASRNRLFFLPRSASRRIPGYEIVKCRFDRIALDSHHLENWLPVVHFLLH